MKVDDVRAAIGKAYGENRANIEVMGKLDELCNNLELLEIKSRDRAIANIEELMESIHVIVENYGPKEMEIIAQVFNNDFWEYENGVIDFEEFLGSVNGLLGTSMYIKKGSKNRNGNVRMSLNINKAIDEFYEELAEALDSDKSDVLEAILTEAIFEHYTIKEMIKTNEHIRKIAERVIEEEN